MKLSSGFSLSIAFFGTAVGSLGCEGAESSPLGDALSLGDSLLPRESSLSACTGVERTGSRICYPASATTAADEGIARWCVSQAPRPGWVAIQLRGDAASGEQLLYGVVEAKSPPPLARPLPVEPSEDFYEGIFRVDRLQEAKLSVAEQERLYYLALAELPPAECDSPSSLASPVPDITPTSSKALALSLSSASSPVTSDEPVVGPLGTDDCGSAEIFQQTIDMLENTQRRVKDLAPDKTNPIRTLTRSLWAIGEQADELDDWSRNYQDYNCCLGHGSQDACGCGETENGEQLTTSVTRELDRDSSPSYSRQCEEPADPVGAEADTIDEYTPNNFGEGSRRCEYDVTIQLDFIHREHCPFDPHNTNDCDPCEQPIKSTFTRYDDFNWQGPIFGWGWRAKRISGSIHLHREFLKHTGSEIRPVSMVQTGATYNQVRCFNDNTYNVIAIEPHDDCDPESSPIIPPPPPPGSCPSPNETLSASGDCVCNPYEGPTSRNSEGECACEDGERWDNELKECVLEEKCFGAVGDQCTFLQDDAKNAQAGAVVLCPEGTRGLPAEGSFCVTDVHAREISGGLQYQAVSVGSMRHDQCCKSHPSGFMCNGDDSKREPYCVGPFFAAINDMLEDGRSWPVLFDPEVEVTEDIYVDGELSGELSAYGARLRAPAGTLMDVGNERYCASGEITTSALGRSVCAPGDSGEEPLYSDQPVTAAASSGDGAGSCAPFDGNNAEMDFFATAHANYIAELNAAQSENYRNFARLFENPNTLGPLGETWVYRDARGTMLAAAILWPDETRDERRRYAVQDGVYLAYLASARRGAGPALLDCLLETFETQQALPLSAEAAPTAKGWWDAQRLRRNQILPGTAALDPETTGDFDGLDQLFWPAHPLDVLIARADRGDEVPHRNIECVEGVFSRYALGQTPNNDYRLRISQPLSFDEARASSWVALASTLRDGNVDVVAEGWLSYAEWDRVKGPSATTPMVRLTDANFCELGRPLDSQDVADASYSPFLDFWEDEEARLGALSRPMPLQAMYGEASFTQRFYGANAPAPSGTCQQVPPAHPWTSMYSGRAFFDYDCGNEVTYWTEPGAAAEFRRESYEVGAQDGKLVWLRDNPARGYEAGDLVSEWSAPNIDSPAGPARSPDFIYTSDERFFVMPVPTIEAHRSHHSVINGGGAVVAAGELLTEDGNVLVINNRSGHYRPSCATTERVLDKFDRWGIPRPLPHNIDCIVF